MTGVQTCALPIYIITVDVARGIGGDYSAFLVFDITTMPYKIVAKYRNNEIKPVLFPSVIFQVCKEYNNPYVLVEVQYEIQKLEADLEFHKQKTRLIKNALDEKNKTLETLMQGDAILRKMSEQFRGKSKGEHNEN